MNVSIGSGHAVETTDNHNMVPNSRQIAHYKHMLEEQKRRRERIHMRDGELKELESKLASVQEKSEEVEKKKPKKKHIEHHPPREVRHEHHARTTTSTPAAGTTIVSRDGRLAMQMPERNPQHGVPDAMEAWRPSNTAGSGDRPSLQAGATKLITTDDGVVTGHLPSFAVAPPAQQRLDVFGMINADAVPRTSSARFNLPMMDQLRADLSAAQANMPYSINYAGGARNRTSGALEPGGHNVGFNIQTQQLIPQFYEPQQTFSPASWADVPSNRRY